LMKKKKKIKNKKFEIKIKKIFRRNQVWEADQ